MFDRFGEMDSAEEINETAVNLRREGDREHLFILAKENGIDEEIADVFMEGEVLYLCDPISAAIGKIDVEAAELKPKEIMKDWVEYLRTACCENLDMARAVRKQGKTLKDAMALLLQWSFAHQIPIDKEIWEKAKAKGNIDNRVKSCALGIPGMGTAKKLLREYYLGKQV